MGFIDLHCDTASRLFFEGGELKKNKYSVDIEKLKKGRALAQFFALFIALKKDKDPYEEFLNMYNNFKLELNKNKDSIELVTSVKDLERCNNDGRIGAFLSIEEGEVLGGRIERVNEVYNLGVRAITLTWNYENSIGYPNFKIEEFKKNPYGYKDKGLKDKGIEIVEEMERVGIIPDASHLSDEGFNDLIKICKKPFIATHSNARKVTNVPRNMTDEMIKSLGNKGGVMGLNFCSAFMGSGKVSTLDQMVKHIIHIRNIGGSDILALGSDFDGIENEVEIKDASEMQILGDRLLREGLSYDEVEKLYYKNVKRVLKDTIG